MFKFGGLGLCKTFERNNAFLAKLLWRALHLDHSASWAMLCKFRLNLRSCALSVIGKGLLRGSSIVNAGSHKLIFSGRNTSFWHDSWCNSGPLYKSVSGPLNVEDSNLKVCDVLSDHGIWDWSKVSFVLPENISNSILAVPRARPCRMMTKLFGDIILTVLLLSDLLTILLVIFYMNLGIF